MGSGLLSLASAVAGGRLSTAAMGRDGDGGVGGENGRFFFTFFNNKNRY